MTAKSHFKQSDVKRALQGVRQAGFRPLSFKIDHHGGMTVSLSSDEIMQANPENPWDQELS